jgi:hypothetical protein
MNLDKDWINTLQINPDFFTKFESKISSISPLILQLFVSGISPGRVARCVSQISTHCHVDTIEVRKFLEEILRKKGG